MEQTNYDELTISTEFTNSHVHTGDGRSDGDTDDMFTTPTKAARRARRRERLSQSGGRAGGGGGGSIGASDDDGLTMSARQRRRSRGSQGLTPEHDSDGRSGSVGGSDDDASQVQCDILRILLIHRRSGVCEISSFKILEDSMCHAQNLVFRAVAALRVVRASRVLTRRRTREAAMAKGGC